jgi:adenine-specific DNA-methyltransferase
MIQLPERTGLPKLPTVADIGKRRIVGVIGGMKRNARAKPNEDLGFRLFQLAESNLKPWNSAAATDGTELTKQLELHVNHILDGRSADDLLYEILLKCGFPLSTRVVTFQLAGKAVHSVADGALLVCLDRELTLELIRAMAEKKPERIVCLDEGFAGKDQLKANAVQVFKSKGVTSFKTV